jgi:hypothetical protein
VVDTFIQEEEMKSLWSKVFELPQQAKEEVLLLRNWILTNGRSFKVSSILDFNDKKWLETVYNKKIDHVIIDAGKTTTN